MDKTLKAGDLISHYRVIGPIGAGGMGEVYLAHDQTLERNVALKVLPAALVRSEERVRRFVLEAKSASSLSHPNIVTVYEIGHDRVLSGAGEHPPDQDPGPIHFIAMELVTGNTLKDEIHQEQTDLRTLIGYLAQAAEGLAKAHAAGIVHRDLKPGNIMVTKDGYAKVLDFGLAKLTERRTGGADVTNAETGLADLTSAGAVLGTVGYMSPEQVSGKPVDFRSDIFSLGCILYEAATRQRPFVADSDVETMHRILNEKPRAIEELNPRVPAELRRLIKRCLAKNPDQRAQSSKDVALTLREIADEYDTLTASASSSGSSASAAASAASVVGPVRPKWFTTVVTAAAIIGVAGGAFGVYSWMRGPSAAPVAAEPFQTMRMTSVASGSDIETPVLSQDGRYLAHVSTAGGTWSVQVRQVATGSTVQAVAPQETPLRGLSFSPDGNYLYYLGRDPETPNYSALFEIPSLGGSPRKRVFDVDSPVGFAPDGKRLAFVRGVTDQSRFDLVIWDPSSGSERVVVSVKQPESIFFARPAWSRDGRTIVCPVGLTNAERTQLVAFDIDTGTRKPVGSPLGPVIESVTWLDPGTVAYAGIDLATGIALQIWKLTYPDGVRRRVTNDQNDYTDVVASGDGQTMSALRETRVSKVWNAAADGKGTLGETGLGGGGESALFGLTAADDGSLLFVGRTSGTLGLFVAKPDGTGRRQLSPDTLTAVSPLAIRERPASVFLGFSAGMVPHVWRVDLDGGGLKQLTNGTGEVPSDVSQDGRSLLYVEAETRVLWSLPLDGGAPVKLAEAVQGRPRFSADGRFVAYETPDATGPRIVTLTKVVPAAGGAPVATVRAAPRTRSPDTRWMPDGSGFAVVDATGQSIVKLPLSGGASVPIVRVPDGKIGQFAWSRDGRTLVFAAKAGGAANLWAWSPGASKPTRVTDFRSGEVFDFALSPDGRTIHFTQGALTRDIVLVRNFR